MKLRVNDTLVTVKPVKEGIQVTIWAESSYTLMFSSLKELFEQLEDQVKLHTEYENE